MALLRMRRKKQTGPVFDWLKFFQKYNIPFVEEGPNIRAGEYGLKCPLCRDDPSHHLGINPTTGVWGCWRDHTHRGRAPHRLIRALLRCSQQEADRIAGTTSRKTMPNAMEDAVAAMNDVAPKTKNKDGVELPDGARTLDTPTVASQRFREYLVTARDFKYADLQKLCVDYNLHYAISGPCINRIIIPVYDGGMLASWTARGIYPDMLPRYKTIQASDQVPPITNYIFSPPDLEPASTLLITEGPFDALKLDFYGRELGVRATCLFGLSATRAQIAKLALLSKSFDRVLLCTDAGTLSQGMELHTNMATFCDGVVSVPSNVKDPGDLTAQQVRQFINIEVFTK